jgi:NAD-dependent dihydropyrimidine dehydrogenase PreA subunit
MRKDGVFIAVEVDDAAATDPALAAKLAEVCPVDIYAVATGADANGQQALDIVESNLDECVLCRLCLDAAPVGAIRVLKLYDSEAVLA